MFITITITTTRRSIHCLRPYTFTTLPFQQRNRLSKTGFSSSAPSLRSPPQIGTRALDETASEEPLPMPTRAPEREKEVQHSAKILLPQVIPKTQCDARSAWGGRVESRLLCGKAKTYRSMNWRNTDTYKRKRGHTSIFKRQRKHYPAPEPEKEAQHAKVLPLQGIPETKYDMRSARGSRVKSRLLYALWASMAQGGDRGDQFKLPAKPITRAAVTTPGFIGGAKLKPSAPCTGERPTPTNENAATCLSLRPEPRQPANLVKSASVPAAIVTSHARPHPSSTASLACPPSTPCQEWSRLS
ncbi:hypothetical protein JB92DRAFT_2830740 [Gautieria morchelliformis]|nr:hypothetical protein JB92DRAFT_2830740 [Gautieria morchelliformis]